MIDKTAPAYIATRTARTGTEKVAAIAAIMLGIIIIAGTGFVQARALHQGTHDTRHAYGLPCH